MTTAPSFNTLDEARKRVAYQKCVERIKAVRAEVPLEMQKIQKELDRRARILALRNSVIEIFRVFFQPKRYKGAHGGRGSTKSWAFGIMLLERCIRVPGTRAVCVREVQKSLEQSVKRLLEDLIIRFNLGHLFRVLNTHIETPGGGTIIFQGMQDHTAESIKSLEGYDVAWVEEAQTLSHNSLKLLRPTLRQDDSEIWFTWNPRHKTDAVDRFLREDTPKDAIVVEATYKDNPYLPLVLQNEMELDRSRDNDTYEHVWLGAYETHSNSRVFKNWKVEEFETPENAVFYLGGDWGYSIDPTVLMRMFLRDPKTLCIDREVYQVGTEIDNIPKLFDGLVCGCVPELDGSVLQPCKHPELHGWARKWDAIADSARPETISYLKRHGYPRIEPAVKGPNSVKEGVIFLQGYNIIIHPRCTHTEKEFRLYSYKVDSASGMVTPILEDKKNHVIDSARYAVEKLRTPPLEVKTMAIVGF